MERWILKGGRYRDFMQQFSVNPLLAKILAARMKPDEVEEYLNIDGQPSDPLLLPDMQAAIDALQTHRLQGSRVRIVGDYDVDGITSTSILYLGLKELGVQVDCRIPERIGEGYGFSQSIADEVIRDEIRLVITCDNGISEAERARFLKEKGVDLIITDHHEVPKDPDGQDILPEALAVVNPHRQDSRYPFDGICGAVVAYQVLRAMHHCMGRGEPDGRLLGYAALGTVCDVMPLLGENRRIVHQGFAYLNAKPSPGIRALLQRSNTKELTPYTAGFVIGPMLNAGGRLGSQNHYLSILISEDPAHCAALADELYLLNRERQMMTEEGIEQGLDQLAEKDPAHLVKVIYLPELHESIAGLVAGKVKEKLQCPVYVLTKGENGVKGSGRSIPAYNMYGEMCKAADLFDKFGGHLMAAGFSIAAEPGQEEAAVAAMEERLNAVSTLTKEDCAALIYIDAAVRMQDLTLATVRSLSALEPYGTGNSKPLLAQKKLLLKRARWLGQNHRALSLTLASEGVAAEALLFRTELLTAELSAANLQCLEEGEYMEDPLMLDICYQAEVGTYGREPKVKYIIQHMRRTEAVPEQ